MAIFRGHRPVWGKHFSVDDGENSGFIRLAQTTDTHFKLESVISYGGTTGLEDRDLSDETWTLLRTITPADVPNTDLASIPAPMRWWVNTYGRHTPAALIHDRFIGIPEGLPESLCSDGLEEEDIDRYFRYMLADSGVEFIQRWVMWSAVALRTRWVRGGSRRARLIAWFVFALAGVAGLGWSLWVGSWIGVAVAMVAPVPIATLWGRQWGAGIVASYFVFPLLLLPILLAVVILSPFYVLQRLLGRHVERLARKVFGEGIEPSFYSQDAISTPGPRDPGDAAGLSETHRAM